uniref:hypothetical protein n=1 Tax=Saccharothrix espanaensis TaxID=103731 RepID=UPI003F496E27
MDQHVADAADTRRGTLLMTEQPVYDWTTLMRECAGQVDWLVDLHALAVEYAADDERPLLLRLIDTATRAANREPITRDEWDGLLRACADDVDQLRRLYDLARTYAAPHLRAGLVRRSRQPAAQPARKPIAWPVSSDPRRPGCSPRRRHPGRTGCQASPPAVRRPVGVCRRAGAAFDLDPEEELEDFLRALAKARKKKRLPEPTPDEATAALDAFHKVFQLRGEPLRFVSSPAGPGSSPMSGWWPARER